MSKLTIAGAGVLEMHKTYKTRGNSKLSLALFKQVLYDINKEIVVEVLKGRKVKLPYIGSLLITKCITNPEKLCFDYKHFNATGEKRYLTNFHSDGYLAKIKWDRLGIQYPTKSSYNFAGTRAFKRDIAKQMKLSKGHAIFEEALIY